jgi:hypothetical protein
MTRRASPYVVGPVYDWVFFLLPPLAALCAGIAISGTSFASAAIELNGNETTGAGFLVGVLIHAHLVAVFFRSHGNAEIFRLHPVRFIVVPIVLWIALVSIEWLAVLSMVVATFWDVWHSGAQTFGFARIYDRNRGVPADAGRRLDFWMNQVLYAGPILAGVTLMDHLVVLEEFEIFEDGFSNFLILVPADVEGHAGTLSWLVIGAASAFVAVYLFAYYRMWRQGQRFSRLKVFLMAVTGLCSIYTWGFNSWGEAFFIMNAFHAVQYLALVWAVEHRQLTARLRLTRFPFGRAAALVFFLGSVIAYGCGVELLSPDLDSLWAVTMVVSLTHFWYDAFIWSVRKKQI